MSNVPAELKYAKSHEWVRREADGSVTIGITDFAQGSLGDLVFVETPAAGRKLGKDESCAVVESVKAASDVYAPIAGEVTAGNARLGDNPEILNSDPYQEGWMWKMKPANAADIDGLLDAAAYEDFLKTL
ncbi:MAG TPA: glycine cleavage system protein GcvH [Solimonas sp.]|nr:glycine cleavage system protein GcvH [Solimonas sp.]